MIVFQVVLWGLAAFAAYLGACFIIGFMAALLRECGVGRRPRFRVVRYDEETD
jgi:hypothetical protein